MPPPFANRSFDGLRPSGAPLGRTFASTYLQAMQNTRRAIRDQVHKLVGIAPGGSRPVRRRSDDGLFGPNSVSWKVHGDFTSMMIGGVGSLLLQMLHPGALAGVWDHSNFRNDMAGRLRRTAQFVSATTYGSTDDALRMIDRVRVIHDRVRGATPDGTAYSANDPELLTWVHVAEVRCFLTSHLRYRNVSLSGSDQDRYFAETAVVARHLGAASVPTTRADVEDYLQVMRPKLRWDRRTRRVANALLDQKTSSPVLSPFGSVMLDAGVDVLPRWAAEMHGFTSSPRRTRAIRASAAGVGAVLRWSMRVDAVQ